MNTFYSAAKKNEPVAYITGHKEFYGRSFICDKRALIPRPETELLIEHALQFLPAYFKSHLSRTNKPCPLRILELGTGCGNIAITLALELAKLHLPATLLATDISEDALSLARTNADALNAISPLVKLDFVQADLFAHPQVMHHAPYDLVVANLPYVSSTWAYNPQAQADVVFYEPEVALFGGEDGLTLYRKFLQELPAYISNETQILIEYGEDQTADLLNLVTQALPHRTPIVSQDFAGLDRLLQF